MYFVVLVTVLILAQYLYFSYTVGMARGKYDVKAPATTGHDNFERSYRVHINTLEQMVITLPAMWICAYFFRVDAAAILGAAFLLGRFIYSVAYNKDPASRGVGMMIGFIANVLLILCCLYAAIMGLI